jgi:hypothetical protein
MLRALSPMGGSRRVGRRVRSPWLAIFAALLLTVQALNLAHLLLAPHAVCAEHGETIEREVRVPAAPAPANPERRTTIAAELEIASDHTHCDIAIQSRAARAIAASVSTLFAPADDAAVIEFVAPSAPRAVEATYRLAPKTSPPSALA